MANQRPILREYQARFSTRNRRKAWLKTLNKVNEFRMTDAKAANIISWLMNQNIGSVWERLSPVAINLINGVRLAWYWTLIKFSYCTMTNIQNRWDCLEYCYVQSVINNAWESLFWQLSWMKCLYFYYYIVFYLLK